MNTANPIDADDVDDDFVQMPPLKVPKRDAALSDNIKETTESEDATDKEADENNDDADACPICLEPWTSSGKHRICSLKCGHLFGKTCIEKWLAGSNNNGTPRNKCPQCNALARRPDIRILYTKKITALDPTEKEELVKAIDECKSEIVRFKEVEACLRTEIHLLKAENSKLKYASSGSSGSFGEFLFQKSFPLSPMNEACRAMCFDELSKIALMTCSRSAEKHGFVKKSFLDIRLPVSYNSVHEKPCRAISISYSDDPLVATTGVEGKLFICSLATDSLLASFQLPNHFPGWSCCFSPIDRNIVYVGTVNRRLFIFDLRVRNGFVKELQVALDGPSLPVHSLLATRSVIYGASLNGIFRLEPANNDIIPYPQTSSCFSLSFDGTSLLLGCYRKGVNTEYSIYSSDSFTEFYSFSNSSPNTRLVNMSLMSLREDVILAGIIDEPSSAVQLWHINLKNQDKLLWQKLPINAPMYSLSFFGESNLIILSENTLHYFKANRC